MIDNTRHIILKILKLSFQSFGDKLSVFEKAILERKLKDIESFVLNQANADDVEMFKAVLTEIKGILNSDWKMED